MFLVPKLLEFNSYLTHYKAFATLFSEKIPTYLEYSDIPKPYKQTDFLSKSLINGLGFVPGYVGKVLVISIFL